VQVGALHDGSVDGQAGGGVLVLVDDVVVEDEVEDATDVVEEAALVQPPDGLVFS
jgi:hypothetical protein